MKSSLWGFCVLLVTSLLIIGECKNIEGVCPPSSGLAGVCVFRPGINCISDSECETGKKCCSEGCGRVCKITVKGLVVIGECKNIEGVCPPSNGLAGICVFRPGINCISDSECETGKKCCSEGCGKVCKTTVKQMHKGQCPVTEPIITTCQFIPGVNCISDSECSSNEKCCSHGCGKICKVSV